MNYQFQALMMLVYGIGCYMFGYLAGSLPSPQKDWFFLVVIVLLPPTCYLVANSKRGVQ